MFGAAVRRLTDRQFRDSTQYMHRPAGYTIDTDTLSELLSANALKHVGWRMRISDWRHCAISTGRKFVGPAPDKDPTTVQHDVALQAGHSYGTDVREYAPERGGLSSEMVSRFATYSREYQQKVNRSHRGRPRLTPAQVLGRISRLPTRFVTLKTPEPTPVVLDAREVANAVAAQMAGPMADMCKRLALEFFVPLLDGFISEGYLPRYRSQAPKLTAEPEMPVDRAGRTPEEMWRVLLDDPLASFNSPGQRDAVLSVAAARENLAVCLPTGGGKTLTWIAAVKHYDRPSNVTVVIVPWLVLIDNHIRTTTSHGVPCGRFNASRLPSGGIVYETPETASTDQFHAALAALKLRRDLKRIVLDECWAWPGHAHFRPAMLDASTLMTYDVPLMLMTGTAPRALMDELLSMLRLSALFPPRYITAPSGRPSIRHCIHRLASSAFPARVRELAESLLVSQDHRALVFVRSCEESESLATELRCPYFHSNLAADALKDTLARWEKGETPILVATTLLAAGYHVDNVRLVVHCGLPWDYVAYSQAAGRGGRNGTYAESHVLLDGAKSSPPPDRDLCGFSDMKASFSSDSRCLRYDQELFLDGVGRRCDEHPADWVPCGNCDRAYAAPTAGQRHVPRAHVTVPTSQEIARPRPGTGYGVDVRLLLNSRMVEAEERRRDTSDAELFEVLRRLR